MVKIRKAVSEDAGAIVDFQLRMAWETESLKLDQDKVVRGVEAVFSDSSKGQYFVAEAEGIVVASLLITCEWSDWRNSNVWWLQSVYVIPDFRRQGVFRKMYMYIRDLAGEKDAAGLRLYVETGNERARKTYESLGMNSEHYAFYEWMRK